LDGTKLAPAVAGDTPSHREAIRCQVTTLIHGLAIFIREHSFYTRT